MKPPVDIWKVLARNRTKKFVRRIRRPDQHDPLVLGKGRVGTHLMAYGKADGKYHVYPTIVAGKGRTLKKLSPDEAWKHAAKNKESIAFDTEAEAAYFSKNYKKVWENNRKKNQ